jgi:hypothetical protein
MFIAFRALISVKFGKEHAAISYTCPYHPMLNLEQGSQCICMEWVVQQAPNFNMDWYGQVLEIFE